MTYRCTPPIVCYLTLSVIASGQSAFPTSSSEIPSRLHPPSTPAPQAAATAGGTVSIAPSGQVSIKPIVKRPCIMIDPEDIPRVKKTAEALYGGGNKKMEPALYGLVWGDEEYRKKASADFMANARREFAVKDGKSFPRDRRYNEALSRYDIIASFGYLTPQEQNEFRDMMARGAAHHSGSDPAQFSKVMGVDNRTLDAVMVGLLTGLNFPELPLAKAWVDHGVRLFQNQLDKGVWDGAWCEVPRYHNWTVLLYSGAFHALQRRTGVDFYRHPNTKALLDWYVRFSSPLVRFPSTTKRNPAGEPTLPVWGDSNYGAEFEALPMFAPHYAFTDPAFSKRLMWMWRRAGARPQGGWNFGLLFPLMADPSLPDEPQVLRSAFCRKMGYVNLRSGSENPDEISVFMRGGQRGVLHPRADLGSIDLFGLGLPLALNSQAGPYDTPEHEGWHRSQQCNNVVVFGGKSRDRTECSGKIDAFYTGPSVDYVVADLSRASRQDAFHWRRHLLLAKPDYLVVWDEIDSSMPSEWFLHTTAERFTWEPARIISHTAYGADLDIHVLGRSTPLVPNEKEGRFGEWGPRDPKRAKRDPYPFTMLKYVTLPAKPGEHFITVLHPRKPDAAPLKVQLVSSQKDRIVLRITSGTKTDTVTMGKDGASFQRQGSPQVTMPMRVDGNVEPPLQVRR